MELEFDISVVKLIFFFSVESLTLTKMDRLTITQCIKVIKTYYKSGDSAAATYRALRYFGLHNRPTIKQAIDKIVKKFKDWNGYKY